MMLDVYAGLFGDDLEAVVNCFALSRLTKLNRRPTYYEWLPASR
jgi:hypothetical protein